MGNRQANGSFGVRGTARVGGTLSVYTGGITDPDGMEDSEFTYQWLESEGTYDTFIEDATGSTYTLAATDQGKGIKVRVSFTDDAGNYESLTSGASAAVTAANNPATGAPTISGTAQVGETLTASTTGIADSDGLTFATFTYQWIKLDSNLNDSDISGATGSTYTLVAADAGTGIKVRVSFTDDAGNTESLTNESALIVMAANNPATGAPTISGTAQVGETLTQAPRHSRLRRTGLCNLHLPVDKVGQQLKRFGHQRRDGLHLHAGGRGRRHGYQGPGVIHRRRGEYRVADQRG